MPVKLIAMTPSSSNRVQAAAPFQQPDPTPPAPGLKLRPMDAHDRPIRILALHRSLNRVADRVSWDELEGSEWADYLGFEPARGDYGFVLEAPDGTAAAAIWAGFFTGHGFVDSHVPELTLSINPDWKGYGLGAFLIEQLAWHGRESGWQGLSLNAEKGHPARTLYGRQDFVARGEDGTMLRKLGPIIRRVAVYCGSAAGERHEFAEAARELGRELARRQVALVYGGGDVGLMGIVANACLEEGGHVIGVMPKDLVDLEIAHPGLNQLEVTTSMSERKQRMEELADAYVALPGGMGTLEELFQVLVRQQLGPYTGPVALMNVEDYWTPLLGALRSMSEEGFVPARYIDSLVIARTPSELFDGYAAWTYPGLKWMARK